MISYSFHHVKINKSYTFSYTVFFLGFPNQDETNDGRRMN